MSGTRISARFDRLKSENRSGLVTFITAGDPDRGTSQSILDALPGAGADLIELGMPFSDPMADGPAIQASSLRALENGANMKQTLEMVASFRKNDGQTPVILMGYYNPIYAYGPEKFMADAKRAGVDGLIVVDLPPEETELRQPVEAAGLDFIYLTAPTTGDDRLPLVAEHAGGFIYHVSITGITGTKSASAGAVETAVEGIRRHTGLPIAVGFGIRTPAQAAEIGKFADAVVVGSALVSRIEENLNGGGPAAEACRGAVLGLVRDLAGGLKS